VGGGRDLAGGLEEVDEGEGDGGWHGSGDGRARLEALTEEELTIAMTLGVSFVVVGKK